VELRAEIRAELAEVRVDTELKFQQVAAEAERRFTAHEEQSRHLVNMVIQTIRDK
jgi:hypothetical protein